MSSGGSFQDITIDSRLFAVAADAGPKNDLGGFSKEMEMNGDGTARVIKKRKPWQMSGVKLSIDHDRGDMEFLQARADESKNVPITGTHNDGQTYGGVGTILGEIEEDTSNSTCEVTLGGPGKFEPQ